MLCLRCGTARPTYTLCSPLSVLEVDLIEEVSHPLAGFRTGIQLYSKDITDLLGTTGPKGVDACGVVPSDIGLESYEFCKVVCEFLLSLA